MNPAILLIHGGFLDAGMWAYQIMDLEKDYKIIAPTFKSPVRSFKFNCQVINYILNKEKVEKAILCGLSYGGFLCQHFARYYPQRIAALILSHTFRPNELFVQSIKSIAFKLSLVPNFVYKLKSKKRISGSDTTGWMAYRQYYFANIFSTYSKRTFIEGYKAMARSILEDPLNNNIWQGLTVILSSKDDTDVVKYKEDYYNTYTHAEHYEFERGGHHTILKNPVEYTRVLRKFIS